MMKKHIITLFALFCACTLSAQTLSQAKKLFENGEYEKAKEQLQHTETQEQTAFLTALCEGLLCLKKASEKFIF